MNSHQPLQYDEPTNKAALALSAAVHAVLLVVLFFGVQWKNEQPGGIPVDVYFGNPAASIPPPEPVREPEPEPESKSEPKVAPKPEPKAVEKPQIDPQIALKDKERREREEKAKLEKERLEKEKAEKLKKQKLEEEKKLKEEKIRKEKEEKARKEEEKKKREQKEKEARDAEVRKQLDRERRQLQQQRTNVARAQQDAAIRAELEGTRGSPHGSPTGSSAGTKGGGGSADSQGKNAYIESIRRKIRGHTVLPPGIEGNPEAIFEVIQLPSGELISVKLSKSTGNKQLDDAIERAIRKSEPLPQPQKTEWFDRTLKLKYKPFAE
ncbi:cell envelope integrity protein TolA [Propionivibrio limicola]|uniref:cell envelope integrity protein TolA n=1 Tax=Propionivibrio limicola TaxID=167645 RepID=UPI001478C0EB|nr:cell envelope integrity protein TolA [Propionivibrio limicola]